MTAFAAWLNEWQGWLLAGAFLVALLLGVYLYRVLRRGRAGERADAIAQAPAGTGPAAGPADLARSFRAALATLHRYVPERDFRYRIPWVLWLGEPGSGKTTALAAARLERPFADTPEDPLSAKAGCRWNFFDQGVALDVAGSYFAASDGLPADEAGWKTLLRLLRRHRGARPIDGVVLTIPAHLLQGRETRQRAAARGEEAFARLRDLQRVLGVRFPVYVLVTRCDSIRGWESLASALPARVRDQIFGWSSPNSADAAFSASWLDEAYDEVGAQLYRAQAEVLGESSSPDLLFQFPEELRATLPLLGVYLNEVFKQSVYHGSFSLRGVYFTGEAEPLARPEGATGDTAYERRMPVFLRDLLGEKVFAERGLVHAIPGARMARDRVVVLSQAAILALLLLGLPGLAWSYRRIHREGDRLRAELAAIATELRPLSETGAGSRRDVRVSALMDKMAALETGRFWSLHMPTSLLSPVRRELTDALAGTVGGVILPVMADSLKMRTDALLPPPGRFASYAPGAPPSTPAVRAAVDSGTAGLTAYLGELRDLGQNVERYRRLAREDNTGPDDLQHLVAYVFREPLRGRHGERGSRFFERALRSARAEPLRVGDRTGTALDVADQVVRGVYDVLLERVRALAEQVDASGLDGSNPDLEALRDLSDDVAQVRNYVPDSDAYWLDPSAPPPARIRLLLDSLPESVVFSGRAFRADFARRFENARADKLSGAESLMDAYGATLAPTADGAPGAPRDSTLSRSALALRGALGALQGRRFASGGARVPVAPAAVPAGAVPAWDVRALDEALAMNQEYADFLANDVAKLPGGSQPLVRGLAKVQLEGSISNAVRRARVSAPAPASFGAAGHERAIAGRLVTHRAAAERLNRVATALDEAGLRAAHQEVAALALNDAVDLLSELDELLRATGAYTPVDPDFATWRGTKPVAPATFGVEDPEAVEEYLAGERARIRTLAETYAVPILSDLATPGMANYLAGREVPAPVARWRAIVEALDGYTTKKPGNTLAALENFIRSGMDAAELGNCIPSIGPARRTTDFFSQRREALRSALTARCRQITAGASINGYDELRRTFNTHLAGRFPFSTSATGDPADDADPEQVRAFFRLYERMPTVRAGVLKGAGGAGGAGSAGAEFFARLDAVQAFLAPMLGADTTGSAAFRVTTEFRANRAREAGADQVAEWGMEVGAARLSLRDTAGAGADWRPGEPVRLTLRWAEGSPVRPAPTRLPWNTRVRERTLFYYFSGQWGLIRMLRQFAGTPGEVGAPPARIRHTLSFNVPTLTGDTVAGPAARVFVRVRLRDPAGGAEMALPVFPTEAPPMEAGIPETVLYQ